MTEDHGFEYSPTSGARLGLRLALWVLVLIISLSITLSVLLVQIGKNEAPNTIEPIYIGTAQIDGSPGKHFRTETSERVTLGPQISISPVQYQRVFHDDQSVPDNIAVLLDGVSGQAQPYLNSYILRYDSRSSSGILSGTRSELFYIPNAARQSGRSRVDILHKPDALSQRIRDVSIVDEAVGEYKLSQRHLVNSTLQTIGTFIGGFCGLVLLLSWSTNLNRTDWGIASVVGGALFLASVGVSSDGALAIPPDYISRVSIHTIIWFTGIFLSIGVPKRQVEIALIGLVIIAFEACNIALFDPGSKLSFWCRFITHTSIGLLFIRAASVSSSIHSEKSLLTGLGQLALISGTVCAWAIWPSAPSSLFLFLFEIAAVLSISTALVSFTLDAGISIVRSLNTKLTEWLRLRQVVVQKDYEIEVVSKELEREIKSRAILEERQRLMRDMHDGIGGQLVSLLTRARSGPMDRRELEYELENSLNDLRLVVYSLDAAGTDVPSTLKRLEERLRALSALEGFEVTWTVDEKLSEVSLAPRRLLDLNRLVQEVITNFLRHSRAKKFVLHAEWRTETRIVSILMQDDGVGLTDNTNMHGSGIQNMMSRAKMLGGEIEQVDGLAGKGIGWELNFKA